MNRVLSSTPGDVYGAIAKGIAYAQQSLYTHALSLFSDARAQIGLVQEPLCEALDAYIASHEQYWQAQHELNQAGIRFSLAHSQQLAQLNTLQHLLEQLERQKSTVRIASCEAEYISTPSHEVLPYRQEGLPDLTITCFGRFNVHRGGEPLSLCPSRNGQAILRYLVALPGYRATADDLMEAFWGQDPPSVARHKLHVAVSALRSALNAGLEVGKGGGYICCEDGIYQINPSVAVHCDVDAFLIAYTLGRKEEGASAAAHFEVACRLYKGPFLVEDIYADWSVIRREQLAHMYLTMCASLSTYAIETHHYEDAIQWATSILTENRCDEGAYRCLMLAHASAGRRAEAIRQFRRCENTLREEMGVPPSPETIAIFQDLVSRHAQ
jgi:DNA-binding SARP family transcriptional activator